MDFGPKQNNERHYSLFILVVEEINILQRKKRNQSFLLAGIV